MSHAPTEVRAALARFRLADDDLAAWEASGLDGGDFEAWLTDRVARRPTGRRAREVYGAEGVHDFARRAILDALALGPADHLLEIGCGGGLLLRDAMRSGARASGVDHSPEMVALALELASGAEVVLAEAEQLPFANASFTAVALAVVFMFLENPVVALTECLRVLQPGGGLALYTSAPELRGTPAAPEPLAAYAHFYSDSELLQLTREAGLRQARVRRADGAQLLTATA